MSEITITDTERDELVSKVWDEYTTIRNVGGN